MISADELTVVHHDDTVSQFVNVRYTLGRDGLRLVTAGGTERHFAPNEILTTHTRRRAA